MATVSWLVQNSTAEILLIFNLFHLLLAGLTLLILLYQLRPSHEPLDCSDRLLAVAFVVIGARFALLTFYFGARFFYGSSMQPAALQRLTHGLLGCALLIVLAAFHCCTTKTVAAPEVDTGRSCYVPWKRLLVSCSLVVALLALDVMLASPPLVRGEQPHSGPMLLFDFAAIVLIGITIRTVLRSALPNRRPYGAALTLFALGILLHFLTLFLTGQARAFAWEAEEVSLSFSLFGFAWTVGERSPKLLDRIFVRLNLTFIVLASLIMMATAGMEKYQYMKLVEQRGMQFAEFLRHECNYYGGRGEDLPHILGHTAVADRVVAEFANIPELRKVNIFTDAQRGSFGYGENWSVQQEVVPSGLPGTASSIGDPANRFPMLVVPLDSSFGPGSRIELLGTMDYINRYIGKYIILIYSVFTVVVVLASGIIGIIVAETDRQLQHKYAELEESHQRLAHAAKLASIGELAGGMAHEINTPITSILSLASHMADEQNAPGLTARQRSSLQLIARQAERVSCIVGGLLNFSRQAQLHLSEVQLSEVLDTAIQLIQYRLDDAGICLVREVAPGLSVRADAGALTEVALNLLTNAIDAMPNGGRLTVRARGNAEGGVRLEVIDAGVGILPEQMSRIFDPFYTTKEPGRGTGLGLSVSHGIVKRHGGEIWAESEPGTGTTFVVTLPAEARA
jgi:two-component system NtrC family sensor kinase